MNKITFLGTGTSTGVPQLGCNCQVCRSADIRDKRLRTSALIQYNGLQILIDAGPDLRQQLITNCIYRLDGILLTHEHYDHIGGLDDIRPLGETTIYAEKSVLQVVKRNMHYCFEKHPYPGTPKLNLHTVDQNPFQLNEKLQITPIRVIHAKLPILGFRIGDMAYLTDVKTIPEPEFEKLKGLKILVLTALRKEEHISHLSLSEAIEIAKKINADDTYLIHASHDLGLHADVEKQLPKNIHYAYDNLGIIF